QIIDKQIYDNYKLWKTNYIAYDLVYKNNKYVSFYTSEEKEAFEQYMSKQLNNIKADKKVLQQIFLKIYANPVVNKDNLNQI
ncbi:MAG: glycerol acyltransferase, partial [Bacteroidetes bacterium]|nr:glycerol acyltransferase [Bacteroidota bacterium]